jgi:hypothetical protein
MIVGRNWRYLPQTAHDHDMARAPEPEGVAVGAEVDD